MQKVYQHFVDILSGQPNQEELEKALADAASALGLPMFAYLLLPEQRSAPTLISNYPGTWTKHYLLTPNALVRITSKPNCTYRKRVRLKH